LKIAITGISGFVGTNIKNSLSNCNYILKDLNRNALYNKNLQYQLKDVDVLIHAAGIAHDLKSKSSSLDYFKVNTELTTNLFDIFLYSKIECFIFISSIKAVIDESEYEIDENIKPNPFTVYGQSKLAAENYILKNSLNTNKRIFILRPTMIYGEGNKGNFNILYKFIKSGLPWPLGKYKNKRTFCSIDNLNFVIKEIITNKNINSGIYNVSDDDSLSVNEIVELIGDSINKNVKILNIPKYIINIFALFGDYFLLFFNSEKLNKLTQNYLVTNRKIKNAIKKDLPVDSKTGIRQIYNKHKHI
jgi:nucleoside-diphosphate-sugar epimerase